METFEIHITGEETINAELDKLGIKNIVVDLLKPNGDLLRTEYMSSFVVKKSSFIVCLNHVTYLLTQLDSRIYRIKIESPFYRHYVDRSLYMEMHSTPTDNKLPISRNAKSKRLMATDRCYNKDKYQDFMEYYKNQEIELCLYDTFVDEDKDWFDLY